MIVSKILQTSSNFHLYLKIKIETIINENGIIKLNEDTYYGWKKQFSVYLQNYSLSSWNYYLINDAFVIALISDRLENSKTS